MKNSKPQLRQVEADIQAVTQGQTPRPAATTITSPDAKPATAISPKLADALVEVAREANRPLTAKELGEQLVLRKFPTTSKNITNLVQNRLTELVKRGVFHRAEGRPGVILAKPGDEKKSPARKAHSNGKAAPGEKGDRTGSAQGQPSLRSLLTDLLPEGAASRCLHATWRSRCLRRALHDYEQELHRCGLDGTGPDEGRERQGPGLATEEGLTGERADPACLRCRSGTHGPAAWMDLPPDHMVS